MTATGLDAVRSRSASRATWAGCVRRVACGCLCVGRCAPHARRLPPSPPPLLFSSCAAPWPRIRDPRAPCFPPRSSPEAQALRDWQVRQQGGGETLASLSFSFPWVNEFRLFFFFLLREKREEGRPPGQRPSNAPCAMGAGEADASPPAMVRRRQTRLSGETPRGAALGGGACGGRARTCERQRPCSRAAPRLLARHPPARAQGTQAVVSRLPPTRVAPSDGWTPPSSLVLLPSPLPLSVPPAPNLAVARPLVHASPCAALPAPARAHPLHTHTHLTRRNPPPRPRTNSGWSGRTAWPRPCLAAWPT